VTRRDAPTVAPCALGVLAALLVRSGAAEAAARRVGIYVEGQDAVEVRDALTAAAPSAVTIVAADALFHAHPGGAQSGLFAKQLDGSPRDAEVRRIREGAAAIGLDAVLLARVRRGRPSCTDVDVSAYSMAGDIAHDNSTGLTWQRRVEHDNYTWKDAGSHCSRLDPNTGGWRLPSVRELLSLVDVSRVEPAIDTSAFPDTPSEFFWSSSPSSAPAGTAWGVNFTRGASGAGLIGTEAHVRCVR
jgi:hypothetical protein